MAIEHPVVSEKGTHVYILESCEPPHSIVEALYEGAWGCEYPEGCDVKDVNKLEVDHFTPKCIAKILGWRSKRKPGVLKSSGYNEPDNKQLLCARHHRDKDAQTPAMLSRVQKSKGVIPMEEFLALVNSRLSRLTFEPGN